MGTTFLTDSLMPCVPKSFRMFLALALQAKGSETPVLDIPRAAITITTYLVA